MKDSIGSYSGIGIFGLLFVLFTGLKLGGVIAWSWWWITAPIWAGPVSIIALVILYEVLG